MKIILPVESVIISPNGHSSIELELEVRVNDIVDAVGIGKLLDFIGTEECMNHFDLVEEKEEKE